MLLWLPHSWFNSKFGSDMGRRRNHTYSLDDTVYHLLASWSECRSLWSRERNFPEAEAEIGEELTGSGNKGARLKGAKTKALERSL